MLSNSQCRDQLICTDQAQTFVFGKHVNVKCFKKHKHVDLWVHPSARTIGLLVVY